MASSLTVWSISTDDRINSWNVTYSVARSGGGSFSLSGGDTALSAQDYTTGTYWLYESMLGFDTSSLPSSYTVTVATFTLTVYTLYGTPGESRLWRCDWGTAVETSDWVPGANLGDATHPLLAKGTITASGAKEFTSETGFPAEIVKAGTTRTVVATTRFAAGTQPSAAEGFSFAFSELAGTDNDPKLYVEWSAPIDCTPLIQFGRC